MAKQTARQAPEAREEEPAPGPDRNRPVHVVRLRNVRAAIWANDTETGLVAYLHTSDAARIARMSRALEFGMVAVNRTKITGAPVPFGGVKQAGLGREGSRHGMEAYTDIKYICRESA